MYPIFDLFKEDYNPAYILYYDIVGSIFFSIIPIQPYKILHLRGTIP